jgi:CRP-like cAMP-binding protein
VKSFLIEHLKAEVTTNQQLLDGFITLFEEKFLAKNSYFLKENQPIKQLGLVMEGVMRIYTLDANGVETNLIFVPPGRSISGNFLPFGKSSVYIQCITDVRMFVAKSDELTEMLEGYEILKPFLHKMLNGAHQHVLNKLTQYIKMNAKERYLFFLQEYPGLINTIPHYHIANYLGITPTQLSRIRNLLARNG